MGHVSSRAGGGTGDTAIKKFIRGCSSYSSFSQRTTFVNKRGNPVRGWLNVHHFARLRLVVLNEGIARKSWLGDDGSGDSHGDCRKYDPDRSGFAERALPKCDNLTNPSRRIPPSWTPN